MKKYCIVLCLFLCSFLSVVTPVSAHILKTDGTIGAVLHIDPDDDPIANQVSTFYFEIKDTTGRFRPQDCSCVYVISEAGKDIFSDSLFQRSSANVISSPVFTFTFAKKDVYTVKIIGEPTTPNEFQSFHLSYDIRVDRDANDTARSQTGSSILSFKTIVLFVMVCIFVMLGYLAVKQKNGKGDGHETIKK